MHSKMHSKYYSWINFGVCYCLKYSADNISRICLELEEIPSIKLTSLTSWYRSISNQRVNHQIFRIVGPCGSCEDVIFLPCPSQSSLFFQKEDCRYFYESRQKKKLWGKGWYFAMSAAVSANVISSKYGARNGIRFKEQLSEKKLARAFPLNYIMCRLVIHKQCEIYLNW